MVFSRILSYNTVRNYIVFRIMHSLMHINIKHLMYDIRWLWCMGLWVLNSVTSGLLSAAPECLLPLSLEWCILLTAGHMKGFILKWFVWCAWMAAWYSFSCQKHLAGQMWKPHCHPDPVITWKGWFLSTLLSNTLCRIYFEARWETKSKCIDCSSKNDEILFEMGTPVLLKHTDIISTAVELI